MTDNTTIQLTREQQATLNNLRAVVKRQLRPTSSVEPALVADILTRNSDMMREAGLAPEQLDYLRQIRDRTAEGSALHAYLTSHIASMKDAIDDLQSEASTDHQAAIEAFETIDNHQSEHAFAHIAYGRHLIRISELAKATAQYQKAMDLLREDPDHVMAGVAESELGRAYVAQGRFEEAVAHFEKALGMIEDVPDNHDERARVQADYATALVQLKHLDKAETLLQDALSACNKYGLWMLRGQVRRELAYIDQMRAEDAQDQAIVDAYLNNAEMRLQETINDLLPISDSLGLAVAYHDLGRLEARRKKLDNAYKHVTMSTEMFQRLGNQRNLAVAHITLGQIVLLKSGNSAQAIEHLHKALQLADALGDQHTEHQAAESLVRIHRFQAKRAQSDPSAIRRQVLDLITYTRARLIEANLKVHAEQLSPLIMQLEAIDKNASTA